MQENGRIVTDPASNVVHQSTADGAAPFGWKDAGDNPARELARRFVERFPETAARGAESDRAHADWFAAMMAIAETGPVAHLLRRFRARPLRRIGAAAAGRNSPNRRHERLGRPGLTAGNVHRRRMCRRGSSEVDRFAGRGLHRPPGQRRRTQLSPLSRMARELPPCGSRFVRETTPAINDLPSTGASPGRGWDAASTSGLRARAGSDPTRASRKPR